MTNAAPTTLPPEQLFPADVIRRAKQTLWNPVRLLTPPLLTSWLDQFHAGYMRDAALLWDKIERRDLTVKNVAAKRKAAPAGRGWRIMRSEESPTAEAHEATLQYFFDHLTATEVLNRNMTGGTELLLEQMMNAVGHYFAVHYIEWMPSPAGLTARLHSVPLWFFESTTGELRFLREVGLAEGIPMEPGQWLVTCGPGLMEATSLAFLAKHFSLKDWLIVSERSGSPGFVGKTASAKGSDGWNAMVEAVRAIGTEFGVVISSNGDSIDPIKTDVPGTPLQAPLYDVLKREIVALWRGADLSTMSAGSGPGQGASVQTGESEDLERADCRMLREAVQTQLSRRVIEYAFGVGTEPLAYFHVDVPSKPDTATELKIDEFFTKNRVPMSVCDLRERYSRTAPEAGDELVAGPAAGVAPDPSADPALDPASPVDPGTEPTTNALNALQREFLRKAAARLAAAESRALRPVRLALERVLSAPEGQAQARAHEARKLILSLAQPGNETIRTWREILGTALVSGLTDAHKNLPAKP